MDPRTTTALLYLSGVTVSFDGFRALNNLSFTVDPGEMRAVIGGEDLPIGEPLTYGRTARRGFEVAYWKTILRLATGRFKNKDNADCVRDPITQARLKHQRTKGHSSPVKSDRERSLAPNQGNRVQSPPARRSRPCVLT